MVIDRQYVGGIASANGNRYEDCYMLYLSLTRIAKYLNAQQEHYLKKIKLQNQRKGYKIDDVVLDIEKEKHCYQLKNVKNLSWNDDLVKKYQEQKITFEKRKVSHQLYLVHGYQDQHCNLNKNKIKHNLSYVNIELFEVDLVNQDQWIKAFLKKPEIKDSINAIKTRVCPTNSLIITLFLGTITGFNKGSQNSLYAIYEQTLMIGYPHIKPLKDIPIKKSFEKTLRKINGLGLDFINGAFHWWQVDGFLRGFFPFLCSDAKFNEFQNDVMKNQLNSFDDIYPFLKKYSDCV